MAARVIDGKAVSAEVRERVRAGVASFAEVHGRSPALATVLVGEDPASHIYVANKHRACEEAGMSSLHHELPGSTGEAELVDLVRGLGADDEVDGILVQLPLPEQIDPAGVVAAIDPGKDVDGLTPTSAGLLASGNPGLVPCTPAGVIELLDHARRRAGGRGGRRRRPLQPGRAPARRACCSAATPPSPPATRAPATSTAPAPAPTSSSPPSASRS